MRHRGGAHVDNIKKEMKDFFLQSGPKIETNNNKDFNHNNETNNSNKKTDSFLNLILEENSTEKNNESNDGINIPIQKKNEGFLFQDNLSENTNILKINEKQKEDNISIDKDFFDKKLLKRNELNVNLIYFDLNMKSKENYCCYNNFKVDVVGGFHAIDDLNIFKKYLENLKNKDISFIVICTGTSWKDVIPIYRKFSFIKEVIIFCRHFNYNEHYIKEYPGYVKKVLTNIKNIYEYIKTFGADQYKEGIEKYLNEDKYIFSLDEIKMDKQLQRKK